MSYVLAGWINDPLMVIYEYRDNKVYLAFDGCRLDKKANSLLEGITKEQSLKTIREEWRCSICKEFESLDELDSILVMLELSN